MVAAHKAAAILLLHETPRHHQLAGRCWERDEALVFAGGPQIILLTHRAAARTGRGDSMGTRTHLVAERRTSRGGCRRREAGRVWIKHGAPCSVRRSVGCGRRRSSSSSATSTSARWTSVGHACGLADLQVSHQERTFAISAICDDGPTVEFFAIQMSCVGAWALADKCGHVLYMLQQDETFLARGEGSGGTYEKPRRNCPAP